MALPPLCSTHLGKWRLLYGEGDGVPPGGAEVVWGANPDTGRLAEPPLSTLGLERWGV